MNRRLAALSLVALSLAAYVLVRWWSGEDGPAATGKVVSQAAVAKGVQLRLNPLDGLKAEEFAELLAHPLFNPGRAPKPAEPPLAPAPVEEPAPPLEQAAVGPSAEDFTLLAIAAGPTGRVAALRIAATGEVLYLREGQPVAEWTMLSVADRSVVVGKGANAVTLSLFAADAPAPESPQTPVMNPDPQPPPMPTVPEQPQSLDGPQAP